jgi:peptidoglycan hydrolase-like protein with peptidoglycan-binding domain
MKLTRQKLRKEILREIKTILEQQQDTARDVESVGTDVLSDERKSQIRRVVRELNTGEGAGRGLAEIHLTLYIQDAISQNKLTDPFVQNVMRVMGDYGIEVEPRFEERVSYETIESPIDTLSVYDLQQLAVNELGDVLEGDRAIKRGARGKDVELVQTLLWHFLEELLPVDEDVEEIMGTGGPRNNGVDGHFGRRTERAVERAQQFAIDDLGIGYMQVDGDIGRQTLDILLPAMRTTFEDPTPGVETGPMMTTGDLLADYEPEEPGLDLPEDESDSASIDPEPDILEYYIEDHDGSRWYKTVVYTEIGGEPTVYWTGPAGEVHHNGGDASVVLPGQRGSVALDRIPHYEWIEVE